MFHPTATVVIPTLEAGPALLECLASLSRQTRKGFEVVIVDNSGRGLVRAAGIAGAPEQAVPACSAHLSNALAPAAEVRRAWVGSCLGPCVIEPTENLGFGAAINEGIRRSQAPFVAVLNDDAVAHPGWLAALLAAAEAHPEAGSCASQVRLRGEDRLDSAGLLIAGDGSSKQRGHGEPPARFPELEEVLCPSGSAALYRRAMLDQVGGFDDRFFLYCEDTDLGLRAQWAGWKCIYVPDAVVEHRYSTTAGHASPLKAYYVERNRLLVAAKNFPARRLPAVPAFELSRYFWHAVTALSRRGSAGRFRQGGGSVLELAYIVVRAHFAALGHAPHIWKQRRAIRAQARIGAAGFCKLLRAYSITPRQVASQ